MKTEIKCCKCGKPMQVERHDNSSFASLWRALETRTACDECCMFERKQREEVEWQYYLSNVATYAIDTCHIPSAFLLDTPVNRKVAEWIWQHRKENIILTGKTGVGKTTGACFVAWTMLKQRNEQHNIEYVTFPSLVDEFIVAKRCDGNITPQRFWRRFSDIDIIIIDEIVGKRKFTEAAAELLMRIIDEAYMGRSSKIWLIGNITSASLDNMFAEPDIVRRRLLTTFACGCVSENGEVTQIEG